MKTLEWIATWIWPLIRLFVRRAPRCRKCILTGELVDGLCHECRHEQTAPTPPQPLAKDPVDLSTLSEAVLLLSGGKDSAYLLDRVRREHPSLKVTCVFVNTGFMSPIAVTNAISIAERTKTELVIINSHIDEFKTVLRNAFLKLSTSRKGSYGVIDFAEGELIYSIGRRFAAGRTILSGLTHAQLNHIEAGDTENILFPLDWWRVSEEEIRAANLVEGTPATTNSQLILPMLILDIKHLGYASFEPEFAQLVREGKADRKTWLYPFELLGFLVAHGFLDRDLEKSLHMLDLNPKELQCLHM